MSTQRNRPGTAEGTEATVVRESQSSANSPVRHYPNVPPINQLISDEVELFFRADQTRYTPEQVESKLLHAINTRILTKNAQGGLKGALAYRSLKVLPPFVIAACVLERDHSHLGLIGESRETARLYPYSEQGPDEGLYVPAEFLIRQAAVAYNVSATSRDLDEVLRRLEDSVPMLEPSEDGDAVALANGIFDLRTKELAQLSERRGAPTGDSRPQQARRSARAPRPDRPHHPSRRTEPQPLRLIPPARSVPTGGALGRGCPLSPRWYG